MPTDQNNGTSSKSDLFVYEYVKCALCGGQHTRHLYSIPLQTKNLSSIWVHGEQVTLNETATIVACRHCSLQFVNPRYVFSDAVAPYSEVMEQSYFAHTYAKRQQAYRQLVQQLARWLGRDAKSLLDVGCGDGVLLEVAYDRGIACTGIESSHALQKLLRDKYKDRIDICDAIDATATPTFDVIALLNVIEHVPAPHELLALLATKLNPNGILFVHTPNVGGLPARIQGAQWSQIEPLGHLYYFSVQTLNAILQKSGFEPIGRFHLAVSGRFKGAIQAGLGRLGIYLDNGLGVVARRKG